MLRFLFVVLLIQVIYSKALWAKLFFENVPKQQISKLKSSHPSLFNKPLPPRAADEIVRLLFNSNLFQNVAVYKEGSHFKVVGYTLKKVNEVLISGNKYFSEDSLLEIVKLNSGTKFDRKLSIEAANNLKEFYVDNGFLNAKIEVYFINDGPGSLDIIFSVKENSPTLIENILIINYQS